MTSTGPNRLLLGWALLTLSAPAFAEKAPATRPTLVDPVAVKLIDELGDPDPTVREAASQKLSQLGRAALPALQEVKEADDPEIRSRVRSLIRKAERRLPPPAPPNHPLTNRQSVGVTVGNGTKTIDFNDNGYRIKIRQSPTGILLDVTGVDEGKEVTESYEAKDAETLKRDNPEAFALYEKYNVRADKLLGGNGGRAAIGRGGRPLMEGRVLDQHIRAMEATAAELQRMGERMPPEHLARIQEQIQELRERQSEMDRKLKEQMDAVEKKRLENLRVPEKDPPAEPTPAKMTE